MEFPVILLSDDDPRIVSAFSRQATNAGMWVLPDLTSQADVLARQFRPDLVILDLNQKVSGCELLARLRQDPATRDLDVIILSGLDDPEARRVCQELGVRDYILKPFEPTFVRDVARRADRARLLRAAPLGPPPGDT